MLGKMEVSGRDEVSDLAQAKTTSQPRPKSVPKKSQPRPDPVPNGSKDVPNTSRVVTTEHTEGTERRKKVRGG
jgi:hypothetical protein